MENSYVLSRIAAGRLVTVQTARSLRVGDKQLAVRQADPLDHAACHRLGEIHSSKQGKFEAGRSAVDRENERALFRPIHVVRISTVHYQEVYSSDAFTASFTHYSGTKECIDA